MIPKKIFMALQPPYHFLLSFLGAIYYGFPSKKINIVGITGTKGKTSTAELTNIILEGAGMKTALGGTLRFKIGEDSKRNLYKMTMPGRFVIQKFIHDAVKANCDWVILEMTSEGVKQFRHKWIELDALIVTNISPEHIESHGSFEKYVNAKLALVKILNDSKKERRVLIANKDDEHSQKFILASKCESYLFSLKDADNFSTGENGISFSFRGEKIISPLRGIFNIQNILAASVFAESQGISPKIISEAVGKIYTIPGRVEFIKVNKSGLKNQDFDVVVDYAHTIDSLTKLYETFPNKKKICVLGNTGGGRDKWKRKGMGEIADTYCDQIILTNEDPYDEDPNSIMKDMMQGITKKPCEVIMDRREAIKKAISLATKESVVLISGKGTDPFIMGAKGNKTPWSDAEVSREELSKILAK